MVATNTNEKPIGSCRNRAQVNPSCNATAKTAPASATDAVVTTQDKVVDAVLDDRTSPSSYGAAAVASVQARTAQSARAPMRIDRPGAHDNPTHELT